MTTFTGLNHGGSLSDAIDLDLEATPPRSPEPVEWSDETEAEARMFKDVRVQDVYDGKQDEDFDTQRERHFGLEWKLKLMPAFEGPHSMAVFLGLFMPEDFGGVEIEPLLKVFMARDEGGPLVQVGTDIVYLDFAWRLPPEGHADSAASGGHAMKDGRPAAYEDKGSSALAKFDALKAHWHGSPETLLAQKVRLVVEFDKRFHMPYNHDSYKSTGMVGLENLGATCYLNSLLQMLYHVNSFRRAVYSIPHEEETLRSSTTLALQSVFSQLQTGTEPVSTEDLTAAFGWTTADAFTQQDVQEMMRVLIDKLEERMKGTTADGVTKRMFAGSIKSYIRCVDVDYTSSRDEEFYDIQLDVKDCKTIYESFEKYTEKEMLDGENKYDAGALGKQDAEKGVAFNKFPPVLTIHLKRFDFDLQRMCFAKVHDKFTFPARLQLDRFLQPTATTTTAAADTGSGGDGSGGESKSDKKGGKEAASSSSSSGKKEGEKGEEEGEKGEEEDDQGPNNFLLHSVLIHAGDVGGGHYYAFIRPSLDQSADCREDISPGSFNYGNQPWNEEGCADDESAMQKQARGGQWFRFDDDKVSSVSSKDAIERTFGEEGRQLASASAYMLVYIREGQAAEIMQHMVPTEIPAGLKERLQREREEERTVEAKEKITEKTVTHTFFSDEGLRHFDAYDAYDNNAALLDHSAQQDLHQLPVLGSLTLLAATVAMANQLEYNMQDINLYQRFCTENEDEAMAKVKMISWCPHLDENQWMSKMRLTYIAKKGLHKSCYVKELQPMQFFDGDDDSQSRRGEYARLGDMAAGALADFDTAADMLRVMLESRFGAEFVQKNVTNCIHAGQDPGPLLELFELDGDVRAQLESALESVNARLIEAFGGMRKMRYGGTGFPTLVFLRAMDPLGVLHDDLPPKESSLEPERPRRIKYIGSIELVRPVVEEDDVSVGVSGCVSSGGDSSFSDVDQEQLSSFYQQMDELLFRASATLHTHDHAIKGMDNAALATDEDMFQREFGEEATEAGSAGLQICAKADFEQDDQIYFNRMVTGLDTCTATASDHMAAGTAFLADRDGQNVMYVLGSSATANDLTEELLYLTNRKQIKVHSISKVEQGALHLAPFTAVIDMRLPLLALHAHMAALLNSPIARPPYLRLWGHNRQAMKRTTWKPLHGESGLSLAHVILHVQGGNTFPLDSLMFQVTPYPVDSETGSGSASSSVASDEEEFPASSPHPDGFTGVTVYPTGSALRMQYRSFVMAQFQQALADVGADMGADGSASEEPAAQCRRFEGDAVAGVLGVSGSSSSNGSSGSSSSSNKGQAGGLESAESALATALHAHSLHSSRMAVANLQANMDKEGLLSTRLFVAADGGRGSTVGALLARARLMCGLPEQAQAPLTMDDTDSDDGVAMGVAMGVGNCNRNGNGDDSCISEPEDLRSTDDSDIVEVESAPANYQPTVVATVADVGGDRGQGQGQGQGQGHRQTSTLSPQQAPPSVSVLGQAVEGSGMLVLIPPAGAAALHHQQQQQPQLQQQQQRQGLQWLGEQAPRTYSSTAMHAAGDERRSRGLEMALASSEPALTGGATLVLFPFFSAHWPGGRSAAPPIPATTHLSSVSLDPSLGGASAYAVTSLHEICSDEMFGFHQSVANDLAGLAVQLLSDTDLFYMRGGSEADPATIVLVTPNSSPADACQVPFYTYLRRDDGVADFLMRVGATLGNTSSEKGAFYRKVTDEARTNPPRPVEVVPGMHWSPFEAAMSLYQEYSGGFAHGYAASRKVVPHYYPIFVHAGGEGGAGAEVVGQKRRNRRNQGIRIS